jgi:probable HAF family extracellular repeat protein
VVGYYDNGFSRAFLWQGGKSKALTALQSQAYSINRAGQVVGYAYMNGKYFAFLWDPALGLMNLNDLLIPSQPDWNLTKAMGINGKKQIVGQGTYKGVNHSFLLNQVGASATEMVNFLLLMQN